jgi:hypothetical protein
MAGVVQERICVVALHLAAALLAAGLAAGAREPVRRPWLQTAPEKMPAVTVRWEDAGQKEVFVVEGGEYQVRVATHPARLLSLRANGRDLAGAEGVTPGFEDANGHLYRPAPREVTPDWQVWIGQDYKPAPSSRARMNVWSAGPYYWECHLLDIPLVTEATVQALRATGQGAALAAWDFGRDAQGWQALHSCVLESAAGALRVTLSGEDPFLGSPELAGLPPGPVQVGLRTRGQGGGAAVYWYEEGETGYAGDKVQTFALPGGSEWRETRVRLAVVGRLKRLRFDPPGTAGAIEIAAIRVLPEAKPDPAHVPARGELVFHAFQDNLHLEFRVTPAPGQPAAATAVWAADTPGAEVSEGVGGRPWLAVGGKVITGAGLLAPPAGAFAAGGREWRAPLTGVPARTYWVLQPFRPDLQTAAGSIPDLFQGELAPLPPTAFTVRDGWWLGYDPVSGLYRMQTAANTPAFSFEAAYRVPSRRMVSGIGVSNDTLPRRLVVQCASGVGNLPGAVLTDAAGFPLPVPIVVAKNFAGECEEPDDRGYGDAYFPLTLAPGEQRDFQVMHLLQTWGNHMVKQVSSIRFFMIYWHLSVGLSESTCFSMDSLGGDFCYRIPDFRPLSGEFWPGQPQHGVGQFPGFLQYQPGNRTRLIYERTEFASTSPCLARFTMTYHTSDDAATARVSVLEAPHRDEMRTFLWLRYDWHKAVAIEGDARTHFRWLNLQDRFRSDLLLWLGPDGKVRQRRLTGEAPELALRGEVLAADSPFVATDADCKGEQTNCVTLVRGFRARLGGQERSQAAMSADFAGPRGFWLTVPEEKLTLQPGDFIEAEVMLMPHGEPTLPELKPVRERERFGAGRVKVEVTTGTKLADFPARVAAADEVARFTLEGGFDLMPLVVEGFQHWGVPLLWQGTLWQDQQQLGGDGYQVEPDEKGGYRFVFVTPIRTGQKLPFLVTRAECTTGISRLFDQNGDLVLESTAEGEFRLKAPVLFAPGKNQIDAAAGLVEFTGRGRSVRAVPVTAEIPGGQGTLEIVSWAPREVQVRAGGTPMRLAFGGLPPAASCEVSLDETTSAQAADGAGTLTLEVPKGIGAVRIRVR